MEKIQERALKLIYSEELLAKLKLPSLKIWRIRTMAIETF
jgi:hypothetical protein